MVTGDSGRLAKYIPTTLERLLSRNTLYVLLNYVVSEIIRQRVPYWGLDITWSTWTLTFFQRRVLPLLLLAVPSAGAADAARGGRDGGDSHAEGRAPLHDGRLRSEDRYEALSKSTYVFFYMKNDNLRSNEWLQITCSKKLLKFFSISSLTAMDKDRCWPGGSPPRGVRWQRGDRRPADAATTDANVGGGGGGGRQQNTPPLKVLWHLRHDHVAGLRGLAIFATSFETSK